MSEPKVKSLVKAMRVLECFQQKSELGITEISQQLGLYKSNVHDILSTLEQLGYVDQVERNGRYRLGYKILELSHAFTSSMGFRRTVYPHMKRLAMDTGETVYLGVPDGLDVVYLDAAYPGHEYVTRAMLGDRAGMYCTGIGKAILSRMDEEKWASVFDRPLTAYTAATITRREALFEELRLTRARGYAVDNMEHEHGIKCVGVAVINSLGQPVAGLSISGPSLRFTEESIAGYAARLQSVSRLVANYF